MARNALSLAQDCHGNGNLTPLRRGCVVLIIFAEKGRHRDIMRVARTVPSIVDIVAHSPGDLVIKRIFPLLEANYPDGSSISA